MNDKTNFRAGVILALVSAAAFGFSGPFAKSLMAAGWSLTAVVTARLATGAAVMVVAACIAAPGWFSEARRHAKVVVLYGIIPVAGAQFCYFGAVRHMSVGVAMLLEFLSPILVIAWTWMITRHRPHTRVLAGATLALLGMLLVLNIFSGARVEPVGIAWGLGQRYVPPTTSSPHTVRAARPKNYNPSRWQRAGCSSEPSRWAASGSPGSCR